MTKVLILGDVHLGRSSSLGKISLGAALNSRIIDQVNILEWTLEQATDNLVSDIIITGDIFEDPKPPPVLIALLIDWLKKCVLHNIKVHIVIGNHDILRTGYYYTSALDIISSSELENVYIYKDIYTIYINSTSFTFLPFRDRKSFNSSSNAEALSFLQNKLDYEIAAIPSFFTKVLIGHFALEGSIPVGDEIDDLTNELICPLTMFRGYNFVWMGHVHKPQTLSENPFIAHIGSMDISNYGETDHKKHIVIFDVVSNSFHTQVIPTRPLHKINISIPKETSNTTQYVIDEINKIENLNKAIVKLDIHLSSPELLPVDRSDIEKELYRLGVHNVSHITESKKLVPIQREENQLKQITNDVIPAVKMYADMMLEPQLRAPFTTLALDIFEQFKQDQKAP